MRATGIPNGDMAQDHIRYDILTQEALRGVVRKVLAEVAKTGLPGEHHFFISFLTKAPGVRVSQRLLEQYPNDMTIVLQNQFWDLKVSETGFEVGLSFDDKPETLVIPFTAIKGFFDPSVQFGLQLTGAPAAADRRREAPKPRSRPGSLLPRPPTPPPRASHRSAGRKSRQPRRLPQEVAAWPDGPVCMQKRSLTIAGHRTSIALEPEFWAGARGARGKTRHAPHRR